MMGMPLLLELLKAACTSMQLVQLVRTSPLTMLTDQFLLLQVLYAVGGESAWREAHSIFTEIDKHLPRELKSVFYRTPAVHWCKTARLETNKTK